MWIAVDKVGTIVGFETEPSRFNGQWHTVEGSVCVFPPFVRRWFWGGYKSVKPKYVFKKYFETKEITWNDEPIFISDEILEKNNYKFR